MLQVQQLLQQHLDSSIPVLLQGVFNRVGDPLEACMLVGCWVGGLYNVWGCKSRCISTHTNHQQPYCSTQNNCAHAGQQLLGRVLDVAQLAPVMHGVEGTVAVMEGVCVELDDLRATYETLPDVLTEVCLWCDMVVYGVGT